jgi:hypothetical protein
MISRYEQEYYRNIGRIADALEKIALFNKLTSGKHAKKRYE